MVHNMIKSTEKVYNVFNSLKSTYEHIYLKKINQRYYVYKQTYKWQSDKKKSKTISEYIGRITSNGTFVARVLPYKDEFERAKALIESHGGEITWHKKSGQKEVISKKHKLDVNEIDLKILTILSMNSRLPTSKIASLAGISENKTYSRIRSLEKNLGIRYVLEVNVEALGFTTYLILVKFEKDMPTIEEMEIAFKSNPTIQFAAMTKGEYDIIAYMLDENSIKAQDNLWGIMSETALNKYNAEWNMTPFGQVYSFVPLRQEFIDNVIVQKQQIRKRDITTTQFKKGILRREFILIKELNKDAADNFLDIDRKYGLTYGTSRYTYNQLIEKGIIIRATVTLTTLPIRYINVFKTQTVNPAEVKENRYKLLLEELEDRQIINKYALIGNTSMPESLTLFAPVTDMEGLEDMVTPLRNIRGTMTKAMIISRVFVGSLCYRKFDNTYTKQHMSLLRQKKVEPEALLKYD